jgi:cytochrome c oxidase cbb3-type subunit 2
MSNHSSHSGFSHGNIESNNGLMIVLMLIVLSVGGLLEIVPLFFRNQQLNRLRV